MRSDEECLTAIVARNIASLRTLPVADLLACMRVGVTKLLVCLQCTYLGIVAPDAPMAQEEGLVDFLLARTWRPKGPEDVAVVHRPLNILVELLATDTGAPTLRILPGPEADEYPAVCHPHVEPVLPGYVCLTDEWQPSMTVADLCRSLQEMLRFEPGTWSAELKRAMAPGIADWIGNGGADYLALPLSPPEAAYHGIRVLSAPGQEVQP